MKTLRSQTSARPRVALLAGVALLVLTPLINAFNFAPAGPEFLVPTTTVAAQIRPAIAMDAAGNSVVVWGSATYSLSTSGTYGQRYDSNGNAVGPEFKISQYLQHRAQVAMAPTGEFVVTWDVSWGYDGMILAKRFDAAGNSLPSPPTVESVPWDLADAFFVKASTPAVGSWASEWHPTVAIDANGNFVIAWEDRVGQDGDAFGIFAKRYDSAGNEIPPPPGAQGAGIGNEFQVNSFTGYRQMTPDVAMNSNGDFVITWWSFIQDGGFDAVMGKRYDSTGNEVVPATGTQGCGVGNEFQANQFHQQWDSQISGGSSHSPSVAIAADGSFVIAWTGSPIPNTNPHGQDCSSSGVFAKRYDAAGTELNPPPGVQGNGVGNEFQVNSRGEGYQGVEDLAMSPDGSFAIVWYGYAGQPTGRVMAKAYDALGRVVTPPAGSQGNGLCNEFEATTFTAEGFPAVAIGPDGTFVIVWDDSTGADGDFSAVGLTPSGIYARRYVGFAGPTPISPLTNEPVLDCPPDFTVDADGSGQAQVPDLRSEVVITGLCAPCASIIITQDPAPGTVVGCGAHPVNLTLNDTTGHTAVCTTTFNVINPAGSVNVVLKVVDQHGQEIPGSRITVFTAAFTQTLDTGDSLSLLQETVSFLVAPGLRGQSGTETTLYRTESHTVNCATTEIVFEWTTSTFTVRIQDQHGADIPASTFEADGIPRRINAGDSVTLPITDESVYPTMGGAFKDGYYTILFPGLRGYPSTHTELFRTARNLELPVPGTEHVFEWITSTYTVRIQDQQGADIPASRFQAIGTPQVVNAGDSVTLPITDESVYPTMGGAYKDGYDSILVPGINGNPGTTTDLYRTERNLELGTVPAEFGFEWIQHQCSLEVRNAANAPVPGSDLALPASFPVYAPGQAVTIPVNDAATYPSIGGFYASSFHGYRTSVTPGDIAPVSAMIDFTLSASGDITPGSFAIGGNSYRLALACDGNCEPPAITSLTGPTVPLALSVAAAVTAHFALAGNNSSRVCAFDWGDGTSDSGIDAGATTSAASHAYADPGVYRVTVTASNDCGDTATAVHEFVVVYDPEGGFVTGGGWISSPAGAYSANPALSGRANFGFVSKYQNGANVPTGSTEFQFKAGDLNFKSTSYDWLVVAGAKAKFKGSGTINGAGDHAFQLTATDGQGNGGGGTDRFRIKIWDKSGGGVIYDNQPGAPDTADAATALGGGSIVVHQP